MDISRVVGELFMEIIMGDDITAGVPGLLLLFLWHRWRQIAPCLLPQLIKYSATPEVAMGSIIWWQLLFSA